MASAATQSAFSMAAFNQCVDPDIDSWVDFSTMPSPTPTSAAARMPVSSSSSTTTSPATTLLPLDHAEDHQTPAKPSHEYERWKQQTGLPSHSVPGLQSRAPFGQFSGSGLSFDDMGGMGNLDRGWNSGLGMGADVNMELDLTPSGAALPAYFFPTSDSSQGDDFVNPSAIQQEEPKQNVRVWPGMHQQQAALVKAQQQAAQQRQQQMVQRQHQQKKAAEQHSRMHHSRRSPSNQITDARTEETIARVVNQIRQSSQLPSSGDGMSPQSSSVLPHIVKMKKDEDEMDEDERLLASEEGKKLSSKERRQLRNKVSARAFRSRRKEYIGQLEGEVALKSNECSDLRSQNRALMEENLRYRNFTEKLLRHPAFQPFLEDLSRDPSLTEQLAPPPMQAQLPSVPSQTGSVTAVSQDAKPAFSMPQQQQQQQQQIQNPRIGMALVPETQVDLSSLNLDNNWAMPNMGFNFQQPQVYAVLELPEGPANPIDTDFLSGKSSSSFEEDMPSPAEDEKADYPVIERPTVEQPQAPAVEEPSEEELNDPDFALYVDAPAPSAPADSQPLFGDIAPEKVFAHFELFVSNDVDESESQRLMERFERTCARIEPVFQRLQNMTSFLDL